jgi:hypothetical protein
MAAGKPELKFNQSIRKPGSVVPFMKKHRSASTHGNNFIQHKVPTIVRRFFKALN